jgi:hypothetical protein
MGKPSGTTVLRKRKPAALVGADPGGGLGVADGVGSADGVGEAGTGVIVGAAALAVASCPGAVGALAGGLGGAAVHPTSTIARKTRPFLAERQALAPAGRSGAVGPPIIRRG